MNYGKKYRRTVGIAGLVLGLLIAADFALADDDLGNPGVVPTNANEFGNTYGEWSARWWQWLVSIPNDTNPNLDPDGRNCDVGQTGQVWFLAGLFPPFPPSAPVTRSCTIPAGKDLLLSPLNGLFGELGPTPESDCPTGPNNCNIQTIRALAAANVDNPRVLDVRVDGVRVKNIAQYRVTSPVFNAFFPEHAIFSDRLLPGGTIPHGVHGPLVSDGYWVLLKPLSRGTHTIYTNGITYILTVTK